MPIKQASNSVIFKVSKTISRAFNQLELIVYTLNNTTCSSVVKVTNDFIQPTDIGLVSSQRIAPTVPNLLLPDGHKQIQKRLLHLSPALETYYHQHSTILVQRFD